MRKSCRDEENWYSSANFEDILKQFSGYDFRWMSPKKGPKVILKPIKVMNMQNFRLLPQKFSEISRFEKFEFLRFCLTLTHKNCHNSLNFWDTGLKFWIYSSFYVFYKSCFIANACIYDLYARICAPIFMKETNANKIVIDHQIKFHEVPSQVYRTCLDFYSTFAVVPMKNRFFVHDKVLQWKCQSEESSSAK